MDKRADENGAPVPPEPSGEPTEALLQCCDDPGVDWQRTFCLCDCHYQDDE